MAGHSKWANIQHRKNAQDKKRTQLFAKLCREVTVSAKEGGGLPENNPRLKAAITAAKKNSVPIKNIENAIKKGTGEIEGEHYDEVTYEGYAAGGVAVFVEASTDNKNRTVSDVRASFTKNNGQLGENGSVAWVFERKGLIQVDASHYEQEDDLLELVIEAGGEDMKRDGDVYNIYTAFEDLFSVRENLEKMSVHIENSEITRVPTTLAKIEDQETALSVFKLIDRLEDCDDVMKVYANFDIEDSLMDAVAEKL
ncbi:MAG: YebC/PmpR family DNA-binding transcriptional regulator [Calditrichaeota bacterium]|nr:YebC/PmpR family DNA-binding transcriptional regulator [Calditrichota bacterium]